MLFRFSYFYSFSYVPSDNSLMLSDLDWRSSWFTNRFQVSLGRLRFFLSCGFQNSACLVTQSWDFLSVCLIHLHFFLRIWLAIFSWLVISTGLHSGLPEAIWFLEWSAGICWQLPGLAVRYFSWLPLGLTTIEENYLDQLLLKILSLVLRLKVLFVSVHSALTEIKADLALPVRVWTSC